MTHTLNRMFADRAPALVLGVGFALAAVIGALDYLSGFELSLSVFYLAPVALVTWYAGRWPGFALCCVSTGVLVFADHAAGRTYSHWLMLVENAVVHLCFFLVTAALLAKIKNHLQREQLLARTDGLTRVLNARAFGEVCERLVLLAARHRHPLAVAYIDIDDFKVVNDSQGHSAGDEVLRVVAETLTRCLRSSDVIGRLGGDEFAVLMPETGRHGAEAAFAKIRRTLDREVDQRGWPIGFSVGVALFRAAPASMDEAIEAADALMYKAKQEGKNRVLYEEQQPNATANGKAPYPQPGSSDQRVIRLLSGR